MIQQLAFQAILAAKRISSNQPKRIDIRFIDFFLQ